MLELRELSERIIAAAIHVHRTLGPGFIEKIYEEALCHAFRRRGLEIKRVISSANALLNSLLPS